MTHTLSLVIGDWRLHDGSLGNDDSNNNPRIVTESTHQVDVRFHPYI